LRNSERSKTNDHLEINDGSGAERWRVRGIDPKLAKRYREHGSGLGKYRWVVERFFAWLHGFRKLRLVTEKSEEMQFAFLDLALILICLRFLGQLIKLMVLRRTASFRENRPFHSRHCYLQ
jgi:hypothetical protein